jgi:hypothetical protein
VRIQREAFDGGRQGEVEVDTVFDVRRLVEQYRFGRFGRFWSRVLIRSRSEDDGEEYESSKKVEIMRWIA